MEVEDDLGIKRGAKKRLVVPNKIYIIIKISLVGGNPRRLLYMFAVARRRDSCLFRLDRDHQQYRKKF